MAGLSAASTKSLVMTVVTQLTARPTWHQGCDVAVGGSDGTGAARGGGARR